MPSFVIHGVVPALALLAIPSLRSRRVLALLPLAFLPDLDHWIGAHRASLHNVFILVPVLVWLWWEMDRGAGWERGEWAAIAGGYLGSHLLMDAFVGGLSPLWPLDPRGVFLLVAVEVETATNTPHLIFEPGTLSGTPQTVETFLWISPTDVAVLVFVVAVSAAAWLAPHVRTRFGPDEAAR